MNNLIYTTLGFNIEWFKVVLILIDSLIEYSLPINYDFLIICDSNMYDYISNYIKENTKYNVINIYIHNVGFNSSKPDIASINKLRIFDYENINKYNKILFMDGDIISTLNVNNIFDLLINDNILYVYKEKTDINDHNSKFWGFCNYTNNELENLKKNNIYPFNAGLFLFFNTNEIKNDFNNILNNIKNHKGEYYYEQSFMNYYFNKKGNINYDIFTNDNYKMFPDQKIPYLNKIIHFCCSSASGYSKEISMKTYKNTYLPITSFDNREIMIKFYSNLIQNPKIIEIGIFKAEFLDYIYNNCNPFSLDGIDLFEGITCSGNSDGNNVIYYDMNKSFIELNEKYKDCSNIKLHKSDSSTFLSNCPDNEYDIIYIDGDHSYNGVKKDLIQSIKKIKNGGYIMGHDYEMNMNKAKTNYDFGVKKAVDEFCLDYKQQIIAKAFDGCVSFCIKVNK